MKKSTIITILQGELEYEELQQVAEMIEKGIEINFHSNRSYKVADKKSDIYLFKIGVKIQGKKKGMNYRNVKVKFETK